MSRRMKFIIFFASIVLFLILLAFMAKKSVHSYKRAPSGLMNQYFMLKKKDPNAAKRALILLLEQQPDNPVALRELGYWYLGHENDNQALSMFTKAHQLQPNDPMIALQLAKLLIAQNQLKDVSALLKVVIEHGSSSQKSEAQGLLAEITMPTISIPLQPLPPAHIAQITAEQNPSENPMNLLNLFAQYYADKEKNPIAAQVILYQIIQYFPDSSLAYSELGYTELTQGDKKHALENLKKSYDLQPNAQVAAQIGYLLVDNKNLPEARIYFERAFELGDTAVREQISLVLSQLTIIMLPHNPANTTPAPMLNERDRLMNEFYALKTKDPAAAWQLLQKILTLYPEDVDALKEAGYISLADSNYKQALPYFQKAYKITNDPILALQAGYIASTLGNQPQAYGYFEDATTAADADLAQKAQQAMTNLGGLQTKVIPYPFFFDLYYAPVFFSRFALIVNPVIARAGITLNQKHNAQLYIIYRWTRDNRSGVGQISTIYQDDTAITSIGANIQPFVKIPLVIFAQVGKAYNLLNVHPRWRNDVRAGLIFYNQWGAKPIFSPQLDFPFAWITTLYSNVGYYSRYENDVIADNRMREGFRVLRYKPSAIDIYFDEHLVLDSQQQFYNNIFEVGPGIVFYPSNRYNIDLRLESLKGYYLPVNSPSPNPYGPTYRNNEILFETFLTL